MKDKLNLKTRVFITALLTGVNAFLILWDHFHDGVPIHYLFQEESLPGLSNWWGIIIVPVLTWLVLLRANKRLMDNKDTFGTVIIRFVSALLFSIAISIFFSIGSDAPNYMMLLVSILSVFIPLYRGEYLLGFVVGSMYVFGATLPTIGGLFFVGAYFILYQIGRIAVSIFKPKQAAIK